MPDMDYHHIPEWHLRNLFNVESEPDREGEIAVLIDREVCEAVWVQSEEVYSESVCCILAHCTMEAATPSGSRSSCVA